MTQAPYKQGRPAYAAWLSESNTITQEFLAIGGAQDFVSLAGGLPAPEFYPSSDIADAAEAAMRRWGGGALEYGPVEGLPALRQHLVDRMSRQSGRRIALENILLTVGAMQALDLIGKVLIDAGDRVVVQAPTYVGALDAWRMRQPVYSALDWTDPDPLQIAQAKFVYTVPNYSNPTGALVSEAARRRLLEKSRGTGTWLVEDDPYRTLDLDGGQPPSLLAMEQEEPGDIYRGQVIYLGTLSKSLAPGLRVGWVVADPAMIQALAVAKQSSDLASSLLSQAIALELLEAGVEERMLPALLNAYRSRRDALATAAQKELGTWFDFDLPEGGMFIWMRARDPRIDTDALYRIALAEKVAFVPSSVFDPAGRDRGAMRVNFSRSSPATIVEGVSRLARAVTRHLE